ncbi:MAG TPA: enoyl-CoA hydratase/isomerase family protein [Holophagaceae bacterium]|nr:enoyl-CoA hydratase/isomerase family protein [Holophagaceae bacterium]
MRPETAFAGRTQIDVARGGDWAWVGLRSTDGFHRLHADTLRALDRCLIDLRWSGVRRVALSGAAWMEGEGHHFCAGADLNEVGNLDPVTAEPFARLGQRVMLHLLWPGWRTLTLGSGVAMGGGCDLLLHGQERWAVEGLRMAHPAAKHGILTGFGGTVRLVELLGEGGADRLFAALEHWDAATALAAGAVQRVLAAADARPEVAGWLSGGRPPAPGP